MIFVRQNKCAQAIFPGEIPAVIPLWTRAQTLWVSGRNRGLREVRSGAAGVLIMVAVLDGRVVAEFIAAVVHRRAAVGTFVELSAVVLLGEMELGRVLGAND